MRRSAPRNAKDSMLPGRPGIERIAGRTSPKGSACPFGAANSGIGQPYSITSSARSSNDSGSASPSALAVFKLMRN
jgi:hypothetical protein